MFYAVNIRDMEFGRWCKNNRIVIPDYDVVWVSGTNLYGVRHVASGEVLISFSSPVLAHKRAAELCLHSTSAAAL